MLGLTPTIVGMMDSVNRTYGITDNIPYDQTLDAILDININPQAVGTRKVCAFMLGSDGRDSRSSLRAAPYSPLPLIARPLTSPLTVIERENYLLRKVVDVSGVDHEVYYAKRLDTPSAITMIKYTTYETPSAVHLTVPLTLPVQSQDWSNMVADESVVKLSSNVNLRYWDADSASLLAACALLGITLTDVREVAMVAGVEYTVEPGVTDLSIAICVSHSSLEVPLAKPGLSLNLGMLTGVKL